MANVTEMSPAAQARRATSRAAASAAAEAKSTQELEAQIARLQDDIKAIGTSLAKLSEQKVSEVKHEAEAGVSQLVNAGQHAISDVADQASAIERDLKRLVREKPLTAVASALGIGFMLAVLSRH
jgi:ElaB/YqjD/DUF883 family membrane-anchored ribosome-binding protein